MNMHFEQIRVSTEKFVNNWSKANNKSTLVNLHLDGDQHCVVNLIDESSLNDIDVTYRTAKFSLGEWLKAVRGGLEKLYPVPPKVKHPSQSNYLFSYVLVAPRFEMSLGTPENQEPLTQTVTAKYFFNGLTFEFTKDELLKLCVDTRAVNAFINELAGRAQLEEWNNV